ncbi:hypothetical protein GYMLUDRAFT_39996 [Collybiopsis luxurians FD-317 M1]|nr:hypothetical protein GYMLUDRAFT_39996 [Collybiopsis luxurians FD-317 M1]
MTYERTSHSSALGMVLTPEFVICVFKWILYDDRCNGADHLDVTSRIYSIATAPQTQDACLIFILSAS